MVLHKISAFNKGMSLVEVLVVIGILLILGTLGLFITVQTYQGYAFRSDKDVLISSLQRARSQSVFNICLGTTTTCSEGRPHGVKIDTAGDQLIIFQGSDYASRDADYDFAININPNIAYSGVDEVVFAQLSGDTTNVGEIILTDSQTGSVDKVIINSEGQILWEN